MSLDVEGMVEKPASPVVPRAVGADAHGPAHAAEHGAEHEARERAHLAAALERRTPIWKPVVFLAAIVVVAGTLVLVGAAPRAAQHREIVATNEALRALGRRVTFVPAKMSASVRTLTLPASLRPNASTDIHAQATGYVRERKADIGDRVEAGDVLLVLDVPLVEEQLNSARAALAEAEAAREVLSQGLALAQTTLERWKSVEPPGAVSQQEIDERQNAFESARANLAAGEATIVSRRADVQRLERTRDFARVTAPFAGTITSRDVELGDYVSTGGDGTPLYRLADTSVLRAFVDVPQSFAPGVAVGGKTRVTLREQPGRVVQGVIARTSGALDERTRTLRVEISVPNADGVLLAGSYVQVELDLSRDRPAVVVPGSALLVRAEGPRVAVVDAENRIRYRAVRIGRDLGSEIELVDGLNGDERVVVNMADELADGTQVEAVPLPAATTPTSPAPKPASETPAKEAPRAAGGPAVDRAPGASK